jgi:hypothetical protein
MAAIRPSLLCVPAFLGPQQVLHQPYGVGPVDHRLVIAVAASGIQRISSDADSDVRDEAVETRANTVYRSC